MKSKKLIKCDFCCHYTKSGCTVTPNQYNCKEATNEFYAWLNSRKKK